MRFPLILTRRSRTLLWVMITAGLSSALTSCLTSRSDTSDVAVRNVAPAYRPAAVPDEVRYPGGVAVAPRRAGQPVVQMEVNDMARYLAGMQGGAGAPLNRMRQNATWRLHEMRMEQLWNQFDTRHLSKIRGFRRDISDVGSPGVLFYPFSGPDFVYADGLFPGARDYVLCGLEKVNPIPDPRTLAESDTAVSLMNLWGSLRTVLNYSYFITKDMRTDFSQGRYQGVLPRLYVFLARTGHTIQSVQPISLNGNPVKWSSNVSGVHIVARSSYGRRNLFYFSANLANGGSGSRVMAFAKSRGTPVTFIKSASYLLHDGGFSNLRNFILTNSRAIVQDPSGVPYRQFNTRSWDITYYGNYVKTLDMFKRFYQPDLAAAYRSRTNRIQPLPFGVGYVNTPGATSMIVARKARAARP